jgi:short-subunit dehydrogenase
MNIWITGASSGIGRALAMEYCAAGHQVIASGRRTDRLSALADAAGAAHSSSPEILTLPFEYRDLAGIPSALERMFALLPGGGLDLAILNAGISQRAWFDECGDGTADEILTVDLRAPIAIMKELLPRMKAFGGGRIAVVGSLAGLIPAPMRSIYAAAKRGLHGFTETLSVEQASSGIEFSLIIPGFIRTEISIHALDQSGASWNRMDQEMSGGQAPETAARIIRRALDRGKRRIYPGYDASLLLARFLRTVAPGLLRRILIARSETWRRQSRAVAGEEK